MAGKTNLRKWLKTSILNEGKKLKELNLIFCSDDFLLDINKKYLGHSTYTDIITFDNHQREGYIEGDIFISIDRVRENAAKYKITERDELHRVMIHGVLHLLGYKDKSPADKELMTSKENQYLALR
jgi:probable rRNA maturation factor